MTIDPSKHSASEIRNAIQQITDAGELQAIKAAEQKAKRPRKGVVDAVEERTCELTIVPPVEEGDIGDAEPEGDIIHPDFIEVVAGMQPPAGSSTAAALVPAHLRPDLEGEGTSVAVTTLDGQTHDALLVEHVSAVVAELRDGAGTRVLVRKGDGPGTWRVKGGS